MLLACSLHNSKGVGASCLASTILRVAVNRDLSWDVRGIEDFKIDRIEGIELGSRHIVFKSKRVMFCLFRFFTF